jgi:hypothetical protein
MESIRNRRLALRKKKTRSTKQIRRRQILEPGLLANSTDLRVKKIL